MRLAELPPLAPAFFFAFSFSVQHVQKRGEKRASLPDTSFLLGEHSFATSSLYWSEEGLFFSLDVEQPMGQLFYPKFHQGDALELFIDTRDHKLAKRPHPFCHHFLFLPKEVEGIQFEERTVLPLEERRAPASPSHVSITTHLFKASYQMEIEIQKEALHGYDPIGLPRIGFTYRLHRFRGRAHHFTHPSAHFRIERHPELWATVHLSPKLET